MYTLRLSSRQIQVILSALAAVSPSGGGSTPHTLMLEIADRTGLQDNLEQTILFMENAHKQYIGVCR